MPTNTYTDPVLTTELREWIQNDTFVYDGSKYDVEQEHLVWNKGLKGTLDPLSEEHKRKIGEANRGKKHSEETKIKIGSYHAGKTNSVEARKKMSEADKSYMKTEEYRKVCSEAAKRRWASLDR